MSFRFEPLGDRRVESWDALVEASDNGTLFHRLDFLAYHSDRFRDQVHHLVLLNGNTLFGVLPLTISEKDGVRTARSPFGGSFGGIAFGRTPSYSESLGIVKALLEYLDQQAVAVADLTFAPTCYWQKHPDAFFLAMTEFGFVLQNRDVCSVVDLRQGYSESRIVSSARNKTRKAEREGVVLVERANVSDFYRVLLTNSTKHGTTPTHSEEELNWLSTRHATRIWFSVAYFEGSPVAGVAHFLLTKRVDSSFYLCQDPEKQTISSLSLLILRTLEGAANNGIQYFDFGTSSRAGIGSETLFRFKEGFDSHGMFRDTYRWFRPAKRDGINNGLCSNLAVASGSFLET